MFKIYFKRFRCHEETDEVGEDEPYLFVAAINLAATVTIAGFPVPLPAYEVVRYGPYGGVDGAETHAAGDISQCFWGLDNRSTPLDNPDQVIFIFALMENDNGNAEALRDFVKGTISSTLFGSLNLSRPDRVTKLIRDITGILKTPTSIGLNLDDVISVQELRFTRDELNAANPSVFEKSVRVQGDGGDYTLTFEVVRTSHDIFGAIFGKWASLVSFLGDTLDVELPTFDNTGRFQQFVWGNVSWHPEIGAFSVRGDISARWMQIGREQYGYPITDELGTPDGRGRFNHFRALHLPDKPESSIYWTPETGAQEIYGGIRVKWAELGWERSPLGYPVSPEEDRPGGGRMQRFEHGTIHWTPEGGAVVG
ncbi:LGFP repeat-containing protein [Baia soyae]|uniref:LGFP repeat-containing protein n=1 Tax=Baia soyae TaxID=1544746 RepID=A0A4R2RUP2_9BACL|nr:hypothetical protein [Baia soyae]TCP67104.1 LGFP repeat-containing protein [Baia soyae]